MKRGKGLEGRNSGERGEEDRIQDVTRIGDD